MPDHDEFTTPIYADDIEAQAGGEPILAVVIGEMGWPNYGDDERHAPGLARKGELLTWDEAKPLLTYGYSTGYGAPDCQAVMAWTESRVITTCQYDGSTWVTWTHRNPVAHIPSMEGG